MGVQISIFVFSPVSWVRLQTYKFTYTSHPDPKQKIVDHTNSCSMQKSNQLHAAAGCQPCSRIIKFTYCFGMQRHAFYPRRGIAENVGRVVASATAGQGISCSMPELGKILLSFFRFFDFFSVVARSLELCLVYGNRLTTYYIELIINTNVEKWMYNVNKSCSVHLRARDTLHGSQLPSYCANDAVTISLDCSNQGIKQETP
ncbi:hypothetical protein SFRURICE_013617 [Spodoptera frugiperda]|nr:hypothetical protein SFRURICE_013617 [Spodoptera frugiperda]